VNLTEDVFVTLHHTKFRHHCFSGHSVPSSEFLKVDMMELFIMGMLKCRSIPLRQIHTESVMWLFRLG